MPRRTKSTDPTNRNSRRQRRQQSNQNTNQPAEPNVQVEKHSVSKGVINKQNRAPQIIGEPSSSLAVSSNPQRSHSTAKPQVTILNDPLLSKEIQRIGIIGTFMIVILVILQFLIS